METIAHVAFVDGIMRPVFADADGQFVIDANGAQIRGVVGPGVMAAEAERSRRQTNCAPYGKACSSCLPRSYD